MKWLKEGIALVGLHVLALVFDAELVYIVFGIDCTILGFAFNNRLNSK